MQLWLEFNKQKYMSWKLAYGGWFGELAEFLPHIQPTHWNINKFMYKITTGFHIVEPSQNVRKVSEI